MSRYKRCFVFLADGARPDVFEALLAEGRLPNIDRYLIQRGSLHHGVSAFPSTTGPAYMPYLTGCYPGTCNVPGIRWFDKSVYARRRLSHQKFRSYVGFESYLMNHDMDPELPTLFELLPRSFNIFSSINRGVISRHNKTQFMRVWNWYYGHLTDHWSVVDRNARRKLIRLTHQDPQFVFSVFPGIDEFSHVGHIEAPATLAAYEEIDQTIGELGDLLEKKGWLDDTILMIVSDHGLSPTQNHFGVNQFLEKRGLKTFYYPRIFRRNFSAASMVSGNGMSHLYFSKTKVGERVRRSDWDGFDTEETLSEAHHALLQELLAEPAIDLMATRGEKGTVWLRRDGMKARLIQEGSKIRYERLVGDPLAYDGAPEALTPEEWLTVTNETDYPDAPVQLMQIFRSPRAGDVILSARPGHDLRERHEVPEHKGTHGSLHRDHMLVPLISSVSLRGPVRSVDIFPTICQQLGIPIHHKIDGISRT